MNEIHMYMYSQHELANAPRFSNSQRKHHRGHEPHRIEDERQHAERSGEVLVALMAEESTGCLGRRSIKDLEHTSLQDNAQKREHNEADEHA
jgi:hypothetical protein